MRRARVLLLTSALLGAGAAAPSADAAPPLVAQYHLDANDGEDSSGNDIDGTPGAGGSVVTGKFHGAVQNAGAASIVVPDASPKIGQLQPQKATLLMWVKQSGDPGRLRYLVSAGGEGPGGCGGSPFAFYTGYNGIPGGPGVYFYIRSPGTSYLSPNAGTGVFDGQWHMLAGTFDGASVRLYLDGALVGSPTSAPNTIDYSIATDRSFRVGEYSASGCGTSTFPGALDEVRLYDRALSATEIARLAAAPGPEPPELVPDDTGTPTTPTQTTPTQTTTTTTTTPSTATSAPTPPPPPDPLPAAGVDFSWSPNKPVLVAGAPAGGVRFSAPSLNGASYQWDFDYQPAAGFRHSGSGPAPRHAFTADGAHDREKVTGSDGTRRRVYEVRVRITTADGKVGEAQHTLVVVPNNPPQVDFRIDRSDQVASHPVTFTPQVFDPDDTPRTADAIDHLEWDFDSTGGDPAGADLVCDRLGRNCVTPAGPAPGPWFAGSATGAIGVNFFERELASHGRQILDRLDVDALPRNANASNGTLAMTILDSAFPRLYVHDPRVGFLYDNATRIQQSTFDSDAGEATGASLQPGALRRAATSRRAARGRAKARAAVAPVIVPSKALRWRTVTLTAVDTAGARTSVAHALPLIPDRAPKVRAEFDNTDPTKARAARSAELPLARTADDNAVVKVSRPLTTASTLAYDASGTSDPDAADPKDPARGIAYYTLEVGRAIPTLNNCIKPKLPPVVAPPPPGTVITQIPIDQPDPFLVFPAINALGTGPALAIGRAGNLRPDLNLDVRQAFSFRQAGSPLASYASLLAASPLKHPCVPFATRNVEPIEFEQVTPSGPRTVRAIVTRNPADLKFRIPTPSALTDAESIATGKPTAWSVTIAGYDRSGLGAVQRTDGFAILPAGGRCQTVSGLEVKTRYRTVRASGQCVDATAELSGFRTRGDVSVNGVVIRPDENAALIVDRKRGIYSSKIPDVEPDLSGPDADALQRLRVGERTNLRGATVLIDGDPIAHFSSLSSSVTDQLFRGTARKSERDCGQTYGTYKGQPTLINDAKYHGSPIARESTPALKADAFRIEFDDDGTSLTQFRIVLPKNFSRSGSSTAPTSCVQRVGTEASSTSELSTNHFADIAKRKGGRAPKAKAAFEVKSTIDLSGTSLGPVTIDDGKLVFDSARGLFKGDINKAHLSVIPPPGEVELHLLIDGGELKSASGEAVTTVPLFAGVDLTKVRFAIVTDPLTLKGGASFRAADVLTGDLDLLLRPDPFLIRLDGSISVEDVIELGSAFVQYDAANHKNVTFGGKLGIDLGPVSATGQVDGGFSGDTGDFFVQGQVRVCVAICARGGGLISNKALAACAEIDLGLTTVGAGFSYTFPPGVHSLPEAFTHLPDGIDLFTGCDLDRFRPAVFRTRSGPTADPRAAATSGIDVGDGVEQAAFRFRGAPGLAHAPKLTLVAPDGRTYTTSTGGGDYVFAPPAKVGPGAKTAGQIAGSAIIDQDPVDKVTTFLVAKPAPGNWKVVLGPGEPQPASIDYATGEHVETADVAAPVVDADPTKGGARIGSTNYSERSARSAASRISRLRLEDFGVPQLEDSRLRGVKLDVPKGLDGKMTVVDTGPTSNRTITEIDLASQSGKTIPIAFTPADDPGTHELKAFLTHADGTPRSVLVIDTYTAPKLPTPKAPSLRVSRVGRGSVSVLVDPKSAGSLRLPQTSFELLLTTAAGQRIERTLDAADATRVSGGRFRVVVGDVPKDVAVHVAGRMLYSEATGLTSRATLRGQAAR